MRFLRGDSIPQYKFSAYRYFESGEYHVTRICPEDVLILVFKGILRFVENGEEKEVRAGEFYIQEKGLSQSAARPSDAPEYYYVHFSADFEDADRGYIGLQGEFNTDSAEALIKKLETAKLANAPMIELHKCFLSILSAISSVTDKINSELSYKIYRFVNRNLKNDITLESLAHEFGYCKNYIIKLFKKELGLTPHEYITLRRIDIAKNLLISSNMSISEIAEECGFGNYVNFYKSFVNHERSTPNEFRQKARM